MVADALNLKPTAEARIGFATSAGVIALDQLTKAIVLGNEQLNAISCLNAPVTCGHIELTPVFDWSMVWNRGVSFGMFEADSGFGRWALMAFALAVAGFFSHWLLQTERRIAAIGLGCIIGGAIGNLIDRARFGAVVDFINFSGPWFGWTIGNWNVGFPWVFNVADAAINVGVALFLYDALTQDRATTS